jgi:Flp pilus assembly protein TadG
MNERAPTPRPRHQEPSRRLRRRARSERGTAVVEFALVAPLLFLILFGIIDFARALNYYNDLTQLAGQGARAASVNQNPNGGTADNTFQHQLACAASTGELRKGITVQITTIPTVTGTPVTVHTSFAMTFLPGVSFGTLNLSSTQTERYEAVSAPSYGAAGNVVGGAGTCP